MFANRNGDAAAEAFVAAELVLAMTYSIVDDYGNGW